MIEWPSCVFVWVGSIDFIAVKKIRNSGSFPRVYTVTLHFQIFFRFLSGAYGVRVGYSYERTNP